MEGDQVEDAGCSVGSVVAVDDVPGHDVVASAVVAEDASRFEFGYRVPGHIGRHVVGLGEIPMGDGSPGLHVAGRGPQGDRGGYAQVPSGGACPVLTIQASDGPSSSLTARQVTSACWMSSSGRPAWAG